MVTLGWFSCHFQRRDNFWDFQFDFLYNKLLQKWGLLKKKWFCSLRGKFFPFRGVLYWQGKQHFLAELPPQGSVYVSLKRYRSHRHKIHLWEKQAKCNDHHLCQISTMGHNVLMSMWHDVLLWRQSLTGQTVFVILFKYTQTSL